MSLDNSYYWMTNIGIKMNSSGPIVLGATTSFFLYLYCLLTPFIYSVIHSSIYESFLVCISNGSFPTQADKTHELISFQVG